MRQNIEGGIFPKLAIPDFAHVGCVPKRALAKRIRFTNQPHHVRVGKAVPRAMDVFFRVGFQMMITMVPHPRDWITRQRHCRAHRENKLQPARHFKAAMSQVAMKVERRAQPTPEVEADHDRQIGELKMCPETRHSEKLQTDQD